MLYFSGRELRLYSPFKPQSTQAQSLTRTGFLRCTFVTSRRKRG